MAQSKKVAVAGLLLRLRQSGIIDHELFQAFEAVPRQNFVPLIFLEDCYSRGAFPIECGQIMTSADVLAKTLLALELNKKHRVLEIGTGSGYQTALLSHLSGKVKSFERFRTLVEKAKHRLETLKISNVMIEHKDGREGEEGALFDRVILNGSVEEMPKHFLEQIASNGILIAPIGPKDGVQVMTKLTKIGARFHKDALFEVRMQPLMASVAKAI
ncbi:MAG: protein-L-isoaspartate(D-aspartate) O-methyltransferase [Nitratireductor sp.]